MYMAPFRLKHCHSNGPEKDYGDFLKPDEALAEDGPLSCSGPGDITRWMAIPWQSDAASCGAGYEPTINPYLPMFWPARIPNQVLSESSYNQVMNQSLNLRQRLKYFDTRQDWMRDFTVLLTYEQRLNSFAEDWYKVGIVVSKEGPKDKTDFPPEMYVEMENNFESKPTNRFENVDPRKNR
jgi:hypothetical protein